MSARSQVTATLTPVSPVGRHMCGHQQVSHFLALKRHLHTPIQHVHLHASRIYLLFYQLSCYRHLHAHIVQLHTLMVVLLHLWALTFVCTSPRLSLTTCPLHAHLWVHLHPHRDFDSPTCTHIHKHLHTLLVPLFLPVCVPGRKSILTSEEHTHN